MPSSRPRIYFDTNQVCNACSYKEKRKKINYKSREKELIKILNKYRSKNGEHDCVVPWSGGKDSSYIAYQLKFKYNMNPLLVTFSPLIPSKVGEDNRNALIKKGFDHILFTADTKISSHLSKRFFIERGNPKIAWDAGINAIPIKVAIEKKIELVFYAEHGESHYGGKVLNKNSEKIRDLEEILEHQIGDDPKNWTDELVTKNDLNPYIMPSKSALLKSNVKCFYFAFFTDWDVHKNYRFIKDKIDFKCHPKKRSPGTFTNFDSLDDHIDSIYYHMQYIKFGFGRSWRDASRQVQLKKINLKQAKKYIKKYDHEIDEEDLSKTLKFLDMSRFNFFELIKNHRNEEIWKIYGSKFSLINKI